MLGIWSVVHKFTDRKLEVTGGKTMISFYPGVLEANHLKVAWDASAEGDKTRSEPSYGFQINFSNLRFGLREGRLIRYDGGSISHKGGFTLISGKNSVKADQFIIAPSTDTTTGLQLVIDSDKEAYAALDLIHSGAVYLFKERQLYVGNLDVVMTLRCAQALGRPDLAGTTIGYLKINGDADPIDGGGAVEPPQGNGGNPPTGNLDLSLSDMGGIQWIGRTGTYPNGVNALTCYTTSCNVGAVNVLWNPPMSTTHPGIILNLYRISNGRFEQIGASWVKHGFYATNASQCGSCGSPGGYYLGVNCSDTYGGGNNDDQNYIGGRDEWNGQTGVWTCQNSYFSNYVNDCVRRNNGSGLGATDHRLTARDADLGLAGAQYYYEARYLNQNDINIYNNLASRHCSMTWTGTQWNFSTLDSAEVLGPTINRWGEMRSFAQPQTDGDVIVAVQTSSLGGMYHYEYAIYNSSSDRQVREFSVPLPSGAVVQNIGFHDIDQDATNDWVGSVANGALTWTSPVYGGSNANPLKYSSAFSFRFDCNVQPANTTASLTEFKPGGGTLTAATKGPQLAAVTGTVNLQNYVAAAVAGTPVTVEIRSPGTTNPLETHTVNLDAGGNFSLTTLLAPGTYDVTAKGSHWLRQRLANVVLTNTGVSGLSYSLINGDVNGDNVISLFDFGQLRAAYGSSSGSGNWNPNADLNGDGSVGLADFGILRTNFGQQGDP